MKYLVIGQDFGCSNFETPIFYCYKDADNVETLLKDVITELFCDDLPEDFDINIGIDEMKKVLGDIDFFTDNDVEIEIFSIVQIEPYEIVYNTFEKRDKIYQ